VFRHSCVFVNCHAGITAPQDLAGRTIGEFGIYGQDSGVWAKGILADDYGFRPEASRWVIGGLDAPSAPFGFVPQIRPDGVDIADAPPDRSLAQLLEPGEIDPGLARAVYDGFLQAKQAAQERYEHARPLFGATCSCPGPITSWNGTPASSPRIGGRTAPPPTGTPSTPTCATTTSRACQSGG
jgi:4,5-dihydroxyphthalate decarboxylase